MSQPLTSRRDRLRQEAVAEIKAIAMRQLAASGASGISITAIAKQMGMTGPALYRYFANRDALLTALIRDGYADLAHTTELVAERAAALPPADRLHAVATAVRAWALAEPHRYLLLFGTPVPGYEAPMDTLDAANRALHVFAAIAAELLAESRRPEASTDVLLMATVVWTRIHGVVSLEIVGQYTHLHIDPAMLLNREIDSVIESLS
ncbi:MAG: TetR/AcrR family transcriptional regulator [Mycobacterium sp.]